MKKAFLSLVVVFSAIIVSAQPSPAAAPSAETLMNEAYKKAAKENKIVFVIFHASWCGWCHRMDHSMQDESCKKFFDDNFVVVHMVVDEADDKKILENPGADEMRNKYNGKGQGIPFWLLFDKKGNLLADSKIRKEGEGQSEGQNTGCPASKEEVAYFIEILKKTTKLSEDQLAIISERFRKNEKQ
jgi:thioredoxin-related protein